MGTNIHVHHFAGVVSISKLGWAGTLGTYFTSPEFGTIKIACSTAYLQDSLEGAQQLARTGTMAIQRKPFFLLPIMASLCRERLAGRPSFPLILGHIGNLDIRCPGELNIQRLCIHLWRVGR